MNSTVIWSFLVYVLWIVLPMLPSIVIYKTFPSAKVGVRGVFANLKINTTGGFAAYLIILIVGAVYWLGDAQDLIHNASYQTWEVTAFVRYVDAEGKPLTNQDRYLDRTNVEVVPFLQTKSPKEVKFIVTGQARNITTTFSSQDAGFSTATLDLQKDSLLIDGYKITAPDTLEIRRVLSENIYSAASGQPLVETQSGPPPANANNWR